MPFNRFFKPEKTSFLELKLENYTNGMAMSFTLNIERNLKNLNNDNNVTLCYFDGVGFSLAR